MALLGSAAMLLWYDIVPEAIQAHDAWHTREHFPERVAIPGFLRAQRWVATGAGPRCFVVYEVEDIDVLSSGPYLERLNHPSPWTSRMMPSFRGMTRGFCNLEQRRGTVLGAWALTARFSSASTDPGPLAARLGEILATLLERDGLTSAFLLRSKVAPAMTKEQSIRGPDAAVDQVLLVTGYSPRAIDELATTELSAAALAAHGAAAGAAVDVYRLACSAVAAR